MVKKKKIYILVIAMFIIFFLIRIVIDKIEARKIILPQGYLLYPAYSNGIVRENLQNFKFDVIYRDLYVRGNALQKIGNNKLLLLNTNCSRNYHNTCFNELDFRTGKRRDMYEGDLSFYMANINKLIFHKGTSKDDKDLYVINYGDQESRARFIGSMAEGYVKGIFQISPTKILIVGQYKSLEYDVVQDFLKEVLVPKDCDMFLAWRSKTNQALCFNEQSKKEFLISLDGSNYREVNLHRRHSYDPVTYLVETDQLFVSRPNSDFPSLASCLVYSFKENNVKKLPKGDCYGVVYYSPEESEFVSKLKAVDNKK